MIIYNKIVENGKPIYEIITKTFNTISVKCDETLTSNDIYKLLSLLENDVDQMANHCSQSFSPQNRKNNLRKIHNF